MPTGRIVKAYNSFFYVLLENETIICKLRGRLKKNNAVCVGDMVSIEILPDGTGAINSLLPRKNLLLRPPVANVDQTAVVVAAREPDFHPLLLNRFLVLAEQSQIKNIFIFVNKSDLLEKKDENFLAPYKNIGYRVIFVSAKEKFGIDEAAALLKNKTTVFMGASGVGKSSIMNALDERLVLATNAVSEKIKRGRHTTRTINLLPFDGGMVADTPGFSSVPLKNIGRHELTWLFPEFAPYAERCRFSPCSHSHEPDCAIKAALKTGAIADERYEAYLNILNELPKDAAKKTNR